MTIHDDPRADPFSSYEPQFNGDRFAHLFTNANTFREVDEIWRAVPDTDRWADAEDVREAALARSRALRAEGAAITPSTDEVWEEYGVLQNDVELYSFIEWTLDVPYSMPGELNEAIHHHAELRRSQLIAAGIVAGPSPF